MALAMRCKFGHSYIAGDIRAPGESGGCPVCRNIRHARLLRRLYNYANIPHEQLAKMTEDWECQRERDAGAALAWAMRIELQIKEA